MLAIWSLVPLPFLNPSCTSGSSQFTYCWRLAWRILSITFHNVASHYFPPGAACSIRSWLLIHKSKLHVLPPCSFTLCNLTLNSLIAMMEASFKCYLNMFAASLQACLTFCDRMGCILAGSSVHGIFQARILEWVTVSSSRGSSQPRNQTHVSHMSYTGRWVLYHCHHLGSPEYNLFENFSSFGFHQTGLL